MRNHYLFAATAILTCLLSGCAATAPGTTAISTGNTGQVSAAIAANDVPLVTSPAQNLITGEQATDIALKHAGLNAADILYSRVQLDWDDGIQLYEVDFFCQGKEYDYDIVASTGEIKSFDYDVEYAGWANGTIVESAPAAVSGAITADQAKEFAIKHAGVNAADILYSRVQLDWDDGIQIYEVELYTQGTEYDYDIVASTGEIRSFDYDIESARWAGGTPAGTTPAPAAQTDIGIEAAKQSVVAKIGNISASQVIIHKDYDDGRLTYEGEVYYNNLEYEFEIDALTGSFTDWSVESIYD